MLDRNTTRPRIPDAFTDDDQTNFHEMLDRNTTQPRIPDAFTDDDQTNFHERPYTEAKSFAIS
jgi:hypothetical protein